MSRPMTASRRGMDHRKIADAIIEGIRDHSIEPGSLLPTERELQERFGAGRSVVRRALAQLIEEGWGESIPNRGVVALKGRTRTTSRNIAFVDHRSSFNRNLFVRLCVKLQKLEYHLVLVDSQDRGVEEAIEYADACGFAAAFVWSKTGYLDAERIQTALAEMPVIALDHSLKTFQTDLVADDNFGGALQAVDHLCRQGRRNIAITGFYDMSEAHHDRFGGYLVGLFRCGLQPQPRNFVFTSTSAMKEADTLNLERRLRDTDRPDAFVILQDHEAQPVIDAIDRCGLRIPEDVALVAFRDDVVPTIGDVALTTVSVDWDAYADVCVDRLVNRLDRPHLAPEILRLPTCLHVRGSCGAQRSQWNANLGNDLFKPYSLVNT